MKTRSIYKQFYQKLIIATSVFVIILSFIFYGFTKATIYEDIFNDLLQDARLIYKLSTTYSNNQKVPFKTLTSNGVNIDLIIVKNLTQITYRRYQINNNHFVELLYPFDKNKSLFIKITKKAFS